MHRVLTEYVPIDVNKIYSTHSGPLDSKMKSNYVFDTQRKQGQRSKCYDIKSKWEESNQQKYTAHMNKGKTAY